MDNEKAAANQELLPLWHYIPLDQFSSPRAPAREAFRKGVLGLWERMFHSQRSPEEVVTQKELRSLPRETLQQAAPFPAWIEPVAALAKALEGWPGNDPGEIPIRVVIGRPFGEVPEVLLHLATDRQWQVPKAPKPSEILAGGKDWLSARADGDPSTLVIPWLERCYLRHHNGLTLVRKLLDWLWSSRTPCLLGCHSWAWSYLCKAVRIDSMLPTPFTLDAFDCSRLERWFSALAICSGAQPFIFRQADSGELVLPLTADQPAGDKQPPSIADDKAGGGFLSDLAAYSLGIPGVAWSIWRHSLRFAKDEEIQDRAKQIATQDTGHTLWVSPWSQMRLPTIPAFSDRQLVLLLHVLLLHNGLPANLLTQLLPLFQDDVLGGLQRLRRAGVIEEDKGRWQVTALGYPGVRQFLESEGYLVDSV